MSKYNHSFLYFWQLNKNGPKHSGLPSSLELSDKVKQRERGIGKGKKIEVMGLIIELIGGMKNADKLIRYFLGTTY